MGFLDILFGKQSKPTPRQIEKQIDDMIRNYYSNNILEEVIAATGSMLRTHMNLQVGDLKYEQYKKSPFLEKFAYEYCWNFFYKGSNYGNMRAYGKVGYQEEVKIDRIIEEYRQELIREASKNSYNDERFVEVVLTVAKLAFDRGVEHGEEVARQGVIAIEY